MDDERAVGERWSQGLQEAAQRAYSRTHGVEPEAAGVGRARWSVAPRTAATAAAVVVLVGAAAWWGLTPASPAALPSPSAAAPVTVAPAQIMVHVSGAVSAPGLVEVSPGARVVDAVEAAGGLTADADESSVNLARPVQDGEHVLVAVHGEQAEDGRIDLNRADAADLEDLPGVGPVLAGRIVADREAHGPFATVEDLGRVAGVGPAILAGIADIATVG